MFTASAVAPSIGSVLHSLSHYWIQIIPLASRMAFDTACAVALPSSSANESSSIVFSPIRNTGAQTRETEEVVQSQEPDIITQEYILAGLENNTTGFGMSPIPAEKVGTEGMGSGSPARSVDHSNSLFWGRPHEGLGSVFRSSRVDGAPGDLLGSVGSGEVNPFAFSRADNPHFGASWLDGSGMAPSPASWPDAGRGFAAAQPLLGPLLGPPVSQLGANAFGMQACAGTPGGNYVTILRSEYNELMQAKQHLVQLVQVAESLERKCNDHECVIRNAESKHASVISQMQNEHAAILADTHRRYEDEYKRVRE